MHLMTPKHLVLVLALTLTGPQRGMGLQYPVASDQAAGTIQGRILGRQISEPRPLANAIVSVSSGRLHRTVIADGEGRYSVTNLLPGSWRVRVVHVGFRPISAAVQLPPQGSVTLDLSLTREPVALPPLLVRADPVRPLTTERSPPPSELGELALRGLEGTPGIVEGGLAQVVRSIPGNDPSDPQDVLLMRGSAADLKLVLLDGAPVYTPFHMAGLVESFDPQALGGASLFLGGAPARFDGGLSYILDLRGRSPRTDRIQGNAALDLLTGRALLEGPIGSSVGFIVGARTLHNLGTPLLSRGTSPYRFGDVLARLEWKGENGQEAWVTGFHNHESVLLDLPDDANSALDQEADFGNTSILGTTSPGKGALWGNRALSAGYRGTLGETSVELRVAASRYQAELPIGDSLPIFAQNRSDRTRFTGDFSRPWGEGVLRFGVNLDRMVANYSAMALDTARVGENSRLNLQGSTGGAYLEMTRPLTGNLSIRGGGRLDHFQGSVGLRLAPRLSLTWMLTEDAALTLAAGRYHQYSNMAAEDVERTLGQDLPDTPPYLPVPLKLSVGSADHLVVSLDQILTPGLRLGLEGFVKEFSGVAGVGGQTLNASGVDLRVARQGRRAAGWLGYTLTWFWASDGIISSGNSPFSGRHLLSAGLTTSLTDRTGLRIRASYGDGLPFTSVPVYRADGRDPTFDLATTLNVAGDQVLNSAPELTVGPDEGFLRMEVEVFGRWTPSISGRTMELRPYLRVLNALNRRDALFYHFEPWRSEGPEPLAGLPLLPLLGLEWRF